NCLVESSEHLQRMSEVVVSLGKLRSKKQCSFVVQDGFRGPAHCRQRETEVMMGLGGIPVDLDRTTEQLQRLSEPRLLNADGSQATQGFEMAAIRLEHDRVETLRLRQSTVVVESGRVQKRLHGIGSATNPDRKERLLRHRLISTSVSIGWDDS